MLTVNRLQKILDSFIQVSMPPVIRPDRLPQPRVWSNQTSVIFELDLPGRNSEEIEVTAEQNTLRVNWKPAQAPGGNIRLRELERSAAEVEFQVPFNINAEKTEVVQQNGVLRITLTQPEQDRPHKLTVKSA